MKIKQIIWLDAIVEKLAVKHHVEPNEVEEVLQNKPQFRFTSKSEREGENI